MLINEVHKFILFLKNQGQNKYHTPEQLDEVIHRASLDLLRQEQKKFEEDQINTDTIGFFKVRKDDFNVSNDGKYDVPDDYYRMTNLSFVKALSANNRGDGVYCDPKFENNSSEPSGLSSAEIHIDLLEDGDWINRQTSRVLKVTEDNPISRLYSGRFEVLPVSVKPILYYLRYPVKPKWAYTISTDERSFIFDEGNSTDIDWPESSISELIEKAMSIIGIPLKDNILVQFEQFQKRNTLEE